MNFFLNFFKQPLISNTLNKQYFSPHHNPTSYFLLLTSSLFPLTSSFLHLTSHTTHTLPQKEFFRTKGPVFSLTKYVMPP